MNLEALVAQIVTSHFPEKGANASAIESFETKWGLPLPDDAKMFYREMDGASLFSQSDPPYRILRLSEIEPIALLLDADSKEIDAEISKWFAMCDVRDGNYVALNLGQAHQAECPVIDCFHETFPNKVYCTVISRSFSEFVSNALNSEGRLFWL